MKKRVGIIRAIIYFVMAAALIALGAQYSSLTRGAESLDIFADGGPSGEDLTLYVGESAALTYAIKPESFADRKISWDIADEGIATMEREGVLTALGEGKTQLTAEAAGCKVSIIINVEDPVISIGGFETDVTVDVGYSYTIEPEIKMTREGMRHPEIIYESDDESIVTVDNNGQITAVGSGTANVTVKAGKISENIIVRVRASDTVSVTETDI